MSNKIINSQISDSAKLYDSIRCANSVIGAHCTIGDGCDVEGGVLDDRTELGRRNVIKNATIGRGSYTSTNTIIRYADIGRYCSISWNVSIAGVDHDYRCTSMYSDYWFKRTFGMDPERPSDTGRTQIGNDVWIASGVIILNGLTIGDGAAIGAGAVVIDDIPPYCVVVGTPARVIKKRFDDETIKKLEELKWWDWDDAKIRRNIAFLSGEPDFGLIVP